jgi:cyclohexanecarboxylate-CoA ligase
MTTPATLTARPEQARHFRDNGWWREETFFDDLATWVQLQPDSPVLITGRADGGQHVLSYRELDRYLGKFAGALVDLGVRPGDVVAFQLPDWWETATLLLACLRVGAIAQPMVPELRSREIERALVRTGARVFITTDSWQGFDHDRAVADMAQRLPNLRHRVVYGDSARTGALDFDECFVGRPVDPAEHRPELPRLDPDRACLVLFTSGSTGESKGVLHSFNTIYAGSRGWMSQLGPSVPGADRGAATLRVSHIACPLWAVFGPLLTGGTGIFQDVFDPDQLLDIMEQADASRLLATPPRMYALLAAQRERPRRFPSLRTVGTGGTTVPSELAPMVRETFGVPLRSVWGMTEIVVGTMVGADDPDDWSAHSDGRALPGLELRVVSPDGAVDEPGVTGALQVRGATLCLGMVSGDAGSIRPATDDGPDGWFDTGDLARPDGRGGIRIVGRVADRIYDRSASVMIPVRDLEDELLLHPDVRDVAVIAVTDGEFEDVCAVVVPGEVRPTVDSIAAYLRRRGMTETYYPDRVEYVDLLPRDHLGKIRKYELRARFDPAAAGSAAAR